MHDLPHYDPREDALRERGLTLPEATEDFPWGHRGLKVRGKLFAIMGAEPDGFFVTLKLPDSKDEALAIPGAAPTGYGLGKSGWVSMRFGTEEEPPMERLFAFLEESYRAVAPKRLASRLSSPNAGSASAKVSAK